jgi:peptidoglycan/LPS O-acetylase OafA/YrhL
LERNHGIDALRAYAVTLVLGFHFFPGIFPGGYLGVDIFFVLSGYFIAKAVRDGTGFSARRYLARRLLRLGPALLLVLTATLVAGWWVLLPGEYISLAREALLGLGFATNLLPIGGDYFGPRIEEAALAHLWSLGVEAQVYLLAALVLPVMIRVIRPLPSYMLIAGVSFAALLAAGSETDTFYNPAYRLWEFALGALAAHLIPFTGGRPGRSMRVLSIVGLAMVPFCDLEGGFGPWALLPAIMAAIALHSVATKASTRISLPVVLLGQASYAIYLWHWPMLVFWSIHYLSSPTPTQAAALTAASIFLGVATYLILERPILARRASSGALKLIAVGLFVVAIAAFLIDASRGAPSRLPIEAAAVLEDTQRSHPRLMECHSIYPGNVLEISGACRHNAGPGPVKTVLWGDSHAAALAGGLIRSDLDFLELSYSGCPPLPGLFIDIRGRECLNHAQQSYERIREDSGVERVIIQARWPIYLDNATNGDSGDAQWGVLRDRDGRAVSSDTAVRRLDELVEELRGAGKQIILITPTPAFEWDLASAATRTMWHARSPLPGLSREDYSSYVASARHHLQEIAKKHGADLIDAGLLFCPGGATECPISDARGRLVMLDEDHLSTAGADLLSRAVLDTIPSAKTKH